MAQHKPPGRKRKPNADLTAARWAEIALEYETGTETLEVLAQRHGISLSTVQHRSCREGWVPRREKFREVTADKIRLELQARYVKDMVKDYDRLEGGAIQLVKQIVQGKKVTFATKDGEIITFQADLEANSLDAAVNSLVNVLKAKAVFVGVPGEITRQEQTGAGGGPVTWLQVIREGQAKREAAQEAVETDGCEAEAASD